MKKKPESALPDLSADAAGEKILELRQQQQIDLILLEMEIAQNNWLAYKNQTLMYLNGKV